MFDFIAEKSIKKGQENFHPYIKYIVVLFSLFNFLLLWFFQNAIS